MKKSDDIKKMKEYKNKFKEEYCDMLIKRMSKGHSFTTFSKDIKVARSTLYEWVKMFDSFRIAKEIGEAAAQEFIEKEMLKKIKGSGKGDSACIIFALKTRFNRDYSDKTILEANVKIDSLASLVDQHS